MDLTVQNFQLNTVENILSCIESMVPKDKHYIAVIYRQTYLGGLVKVDLWTSDIEDELNEIINRYNSVLVDAYECTALFKDGIMLDEKNGCTLFKRNCRACKHKIPTSKDSEGNPTEYKCDVFDCDPSFVTYICFNNEKKEKVK